MCLAYKTSYANPHFSTILSRVKAVLRMPHGHKILEGPQNGKSTSNDPDRVETNYAFCCICMVGQWKQPYSAMSGIIQPCQLPGSHSHAPGETILVSELHQLCKRSHHARNIIGSPSVGLQMCKRGCSQLATSPEDMKFVMSCLNMVMLASIYVPRLLHARETFS